MAVNLTEDDLKYWRSVLEGRAKWDTALGTDCEELCRLLLEDIHEARDRAREYLPAHKYQWDNYRQGCQFEQAERNRYPWLGESEDPLDNEDDG